MNKLTDNKDQLYDAKQPRARNLPFPLTLATVVGLGCFVLELDRKRQRWLDERARASYEHKWENHHEDRVPNSNGDLRRFV